MRRRRVIRESRPGGADGETEFVELAPDELAGVFAAPPWLRDLGMLSWLLVGVTLLTIGAIWLLSLTNTIVTPVVTATIIAAVLSPVVRFLQHHGVPRGAGAAIVFVGVIVAGVLVAGLIITGITSQVPELERALKSATGKLQTALQDAGVSSDAAKQAHDTASASVGSAFHALLKGLGTGVKELGSLVIFLSFTALSLFFLLKDGPRIRTWLEAHTGLPEAVGRTVGARTLQALRG